MKFNNLSQEYIDKIVLVAYGDGGFVDEIKIYLDARKNPELKKLLNEYRQTAKEVRSLKNEIYTGQTNIKVQKKNNLIEYFIKAFVRKPVFSAAFTLLLIGGISSYLILSNNSPNYNYTQTEVIKAERDLNESFSIINAYFNQTSNAIEINVIKEKINEPIEKSIKVLNNYLNGG